MTKEDLETFLKDNGVNVVDKLTNTRIAIKVLLYGSTVDNDDVLSKVQIFDQVSIQNVVNDGTRTVVTYAYPVADSVNLYNAVSEEDKAMFDRHAKEIEEAYKNMGLK